MSFEELRLLILEGHKPGDFLSISRLMRETRQSRAEISSALEKMRVRGEVRMQGEGRGQRYFLVEQDASLTSLASELKQLIGVRGELLSRWHEFPDPGWGLPEAEPNTLPVCRRVQDSAKDGVIVRRVHESAAQRTRRSAAMVKMDTQMFTFHRIRASVPTWASESFHAHALADLSTPPGSEEPSEPGDLAEEPEPSTSTVDSSRRRVSDWSDPVQLRSWKNLQVRFIVFETLYFLLHEAESMTRLKELPKKIRAAVQAERSGQRPCSVHEILAGVGLPPSFTSHTVRSARMTDKERNIYRQHVGREPRQSYLMLELVTWANDYPILYSREYIGSMLELKVSGFRIGATSGATIFD